MARAVPPRFEQPGILAFAAWLAVVAFFVPSLSGTRASLGDLVGGTPQIARLLGEMLPPSTVRLRPVGWALLETFQMAFVGTVIGVLLSVPLAVLDSRHLCLHPDVYHAARTAIAFFRTVPALVWALLFVVSVGLGPFAGVLAIIVDKLGFCGRFFAEAMEEAERGPQEALAAIGARRSGLVACAVLPAAMPSFVATLLFSLEKATRSSVVLGLVGAGGILEHEDPAMVILHKTANVTAKRRDLKWKSARSFVPPRRCVASRCMIWTASSWPRSWPTVRWCLARPPPSQW